MTDLARRPWGSGLITADEWLARMGDWYVPEPNTGCHLWLRSVDGCGYGMQNMNGRTHRAHRIVYELLRGPIPAGLTIDHLCRTPGCVNPDHMEVVTVGVNGLRGNTMGARHARQTHCIHGHPLTPENLYKTKGRRLCATCSRADYRVNREKRLASRRASRLVNREEINRKRRESRRARKQAGHFC